MASAIDSLSPPSAPTRVYYSLGRMLGVEDFQADQNYHRGQLARALLQLCGTGTIAGLKVVFPQVWQANTVYPPGAFVYDPSQNIQVNTGTVGISGTTPPAFSAVAGGPPADDANGVAWTNQGPINPKGWRPNTPYAFPAALVDSNGNIQVLNVKPNFTTGAVQPAWNTAIGSLTTDGTTTAWACAGTSQLEIVVTPGLAIDRAGRMIEVPRSVCIRIEPWLAAQSAVDLNTALHGGNVLVDVFATFVPCTSGVTPCFAANDDYSATDAFSANRLLDSFAMQLVLRTEAAPKLPQDQWLLTGPVPAGAITPASAQSLKQSILGAKSGAAATAPFAAGGAIPVEYPAEFDASSVFLARITIPAKAGAAGQAPVFTPIGITIDNLSRLFLYPSSLVARSIGLTSGTES